MGWGVAKNEAAMVAFYEDGEGIIVSHRGEFMESEIKSMSRHTGDHAWSRGELAGRVGLWVWEGDVHVDDGNNGMMERTDPDVNYNGTWRRPKAMELIAMTKGADVWPAAPAAGTRGEDKK